MFDAREVTLLEPANFPQYNMEEMQSFQQYCVDEDVKNDERMEAKALFHSTNLKEGTKKRQNDYVWIAYSMDPELYRSATTGNTVAFQEASADTERSPLDQVSPRQNTVLHLAARSGHHQLVDSILKRFPQLVMRKNYTGDLALHVAARGGHLSIVKMMVLSSSGDIKSLLNEVNNQGNTALHATLENRHEEVAKFLVRYTDPTLSYYPNKENKSPLWLATEAGYLELIRTMIDKEPIGSDSLEVEGPSVEESVDNIVSRQEQGRSNTPYESLEGKSLLHAAIRGKNIDVLDTIYQKNPTLINSIDEEGRTPLSLAAYIGYLDGARYLLDKSTDETYQRGSPQRSSYGFFPIHAASMMGHIKIVQEFLQHCPDSRELLDKQGQNILHAAAKCGKAKLVSYMLKTRDLEMLINERDLEGNTPLHLATLNWHPKVVSILTWDKRVDLKPVNDDGHTAIDVAEKYMGTKPPFRKRLTLMALKSAKAPRAEHDSIFRENSVSFPSLEPPNKDQYNERVNTLLLVATLVATMTFAAGFTMPGGFNSSGSQGEGMVTLVMKRRLHVFLICNTIAMYSSITAVVILIWAQLGDLSLILAAFKLALPLLGVALTMMSLAFMTGVYLVVGNLSWLANVVLIMGSIFVIIISAFFLLLLSPLSSSNVILRYIVYYPFCLMIWVTRSNIQDRSHKFKNVVVLKADFQNETPFYR